MGIQKVGDTLIVRSASSYYHVGNSTPGKKLKNRKRFSSSITVRLEGFWLVSSAKLCMVGTGTGYSMPRLERVRVLIGFGDSVARWSFNLNATLVGEGWWGEEKNQWCIGCHFLGMQESMANVHMGDCSTRMSLRFPKIWSIHDASSIEGQIQSNKSVRDLGFFKGVVLRNFQYRRVEISGIKYEYSQLDKVRRLCPRQKTE
ncbi:hypothetical protein Fmac_021090 [Flemingia macrophylla]|uniref:DUF2921 domain-containing protein n=1 Tax=Flemingia macrophylla TaxID=520843 RepID=A0ABD1LWD5_9FABA